MSLQLMPIVSIIFSPGTSQPFGRLAASLTVPSCLIYGQEDPWVGCLMPASLSMATLEMHQMRMHRVPQLGSKELWIPELKDESKYVYFARHGTEVC